MSIFKLNYSFCRMKYAFALPILNVDMQFVNERRKEIEVCRVELKKKIATIDIESITGADEFGIAANLVNHYFMACCLLNQKENDLTQGYKPEKTYTDKERKRRTSRID